MAGILRQVLAQAFEQASRVRPFLHQGGRIEERAHERHALQAVTLGRVRCFRQRDADAVHRADPDLALADCPLRCLGKAVPQFVAGQVALDDEYAAVAHSAQRVGMLEYIGVVGNHDVDVLEARNSGAGAL